mmetsp:Transcript_6109/g.11565  ORF Transcript_6109/g.11565 Transcript_6109/m.11565 type:complete len:214 (+) Transcript_6109:29-670(+)
MDKCVKFLGQTDGRDKLAKGLQNYCRFMTWYVADPSKAKDWKKVQSSLSEFRSIIKFGKWLKSYQEGQEILEQDKLGLVDLVDLAAKVGDIGYKIGDNLEYLSTYKFLPFEPEKLERISKTFQFFAYLGDVIVGLHNLSNLRPKKGESEEAFARRRAMAVIGFMGDFADFCRVTPGFLAMHNVGGVKDHKGWAGACGILVGVIGSYKVWKKLK